MTPFAFTEAVPNPRTRTNISPRLDYQLSKNNTLTARYQYYRDTQNNDGIGQFNLAPQAYDSESTEHTLQISDTQVFGSKIVNETRFQYLRERDSQLPVSTTPGGERPGIIYRAAATTRHHHRSPGPLRTAELHLGDSRQSHLQVRRTSARGARRQLFPIRIQRHLHLFVAEFARRHAVQSQLRHCRQSSDALPHLLSIRRATAGDSGRNALCNPALVYQGSPNADVTTYDAGLYVQDDWRVRPNITLSSGLRFETQNDIHDHGDWAPRLGIAWGVGGKSAPPKVVLRGGFGIFYDRFQSEQLLQAERLNGITQQQFVINNPTCFPGLGMPLVLSTCGTASVEHADDLPDRSPTARALHPAVGDQRGAAAHQVSDPVGHLSEFSRLRSVAHHQRQCPFSGDARQHHSSAQPGRWKYLPVRVRRKLHAEPAHREHQRAAGNQGPSVWLLHAELRQQRYCRRLQLSVELLQHQPGLRPRFVRHSPSSLFRRNDRLAVRLSSEPVHGREFRFAL